MHMRTDVGPRRISEALIGCCCYYLGVERGQCIFAVVTNNRDSSLLKDFLLLTGWFCDVRIL